MLPVIPAVLLMALQGVAGLEPAANEAALAGAKRCAAAHPAGKGRAPRLSAERWEWNLEAQTASLDSAVSLLGLLAQLISIAGTAIAPADEIAGLEGTAPDLFRGRYAPPNVGQASPGFLNCRRTRDGPSAE
jgi:hypothetical protein